MRYDSAPDTIAHIQQVQELLNRALVNLRLRQITHDQTKLESPEKEIFDEYSPKLREVTYGSGEYNTYLLGMQVALEHHYAHNSHHPEHFDNGIHGMSLLDLLEMLIDWKAASMRHADGDLLRSIVINQERFGYSDELKEILLNTVKELDLG